MPIRLPLRCCLIAILLLACAPARADTARWQAVLVAGDNAQPVFDNAIDAMARWLADRGVPTTDIHRLSASQTAGDPALEPATADQILQRIASLRPRPGERCLIFITSHGQRGEGIWLARSEEYLRPASLARALSAGCSQVPTVVILSACYSGAFTVGAMQAPNRIILSAARADRPSFGCQADRTYTVFDECLLASLPGASTWRAVNAGSLRCVKARERRLGVLPSQPQASFGAATRDLTVR